MRHYELVVVLSPMISPDEAGQAWERIKGYITTREAEIVHEERWGTRRLAYPVRKGQYQFLEGNYHLTRFTTDQSFNRELENFLKLDDNVLRSLVTATVSEEEIAAHAAQTRAPRPPRPPAGAAPAGVPPVVAPAGAAPAPAEAAPAEGGSAPAAVAEPSQPEAPAEEPAAAPAPEASEPAVTPAPEASEPAVAPAPEASEPAVAPVSEASEPAAAPVPEPAPPAESEPEQPTE